MKRKVFFEQHFSQREDFRVFELEESMLSALQEGAKLVIKGSAEDSAVLCTEDATHVVKLAETTNTVLLIPPSSDANEPLRARALISHFYELKRTAPRTTLLRTVLVPYAGAEHEADIGQEPLELHELRSRVQASDAELEKALREVNAFEMHGRWRVLDREYAAQIMELVLASAVENDWDLADVSVAATLEALPDYDATAVMHTLSSYGDIGEAQQRVSLRTARVTQFYGERLLMEKRRQPLEEFMVAWNDSMTLDGLPEPSINLLSGIAVTEKKGRNVMVHYFPQDALPMDMEQRFKRLFEQCTTWDLPQIQPYIQPLLEPGETTDALLLRYCYIDKTDPKVVRVSKR